LNQLNKSDEVFSFRIVDGEKDAIISAVLEAKFKELFFLSRVCESGDSIQKLPTEHLRTSKLLGHCGQFPRRIDFLDVASFFADLQDTSNALIGECVQRLSLARSLIGEVGCDAGIYRNATLRHVAGQKCNPSLERLNGIRSGRLWLHSEVLQSLILSQLVLTLHCRSNIPQFLHQSEGAYRLHGLDTARGFSTHDTQFDETRSEIECEDSKEVQDSIQSVKIDLLSVSIKELELFQLEGLAKKEIADYRKSDCTYESDAGVRNYPSQIALRVCLFYETAVNLTISIFDISAKIAAKLLWFAKSVEIESGSFASQLESTLIPETDPVMASFMSTLGPHYDQLLEDSKNLTFDVAEALNSVETCGAKDSNGQGQKSLTVNDLEERVANLCSLVRSYVDFMGDHFARLI